LKPEIDSGDALAINRAGWDRVAPIFHGGTALPEYGPLAPTEDTLRLLELTPDFRALELGCGSGHSLRYLAERGACELWGLDLSPVQIAFAEETLRPFADRVRLVESPMEVNPGVPSGFFDLGEHPAYGCLEWNGTQYVTAEPYSAEGGVAHSSWKGVPIVIQRRTLGTFVTEIARAGLRIEALVEGELNADLAKEAHADPARWYSVPRARLMPTTFIIKARKPTSATLTATPVKR